MTVYDDGSKEIVPFTLNADYIVFSADSFSVYIVVETGENARLFVEFRTADGTEANPDAGLIEREGVTYAQLAYLNDYIFDPGVPELNGMIFKGWANSLNYTSETNPKTIATVRSEVTTKLNSG